MAKTTKHVTFKLPIEEENHPQPPMSKMMRHAACKLPNTVPVSIKLDSLPRAVAHRSPKIHPVSIKLDSLPRAVDHRSPKRLPVSIKLDSLPRTVDHRSPKRLPVSIKLDSPSAELIGEVKKVQTRVSELEKNLTEEVAARKELHASVEQLKVDNVEAKHMAQAANDVRVPVLSLLQALPCQSLGEVDKLLEFVANHTLQWTEYIKLLGGPDFNSAIKTVMDAIMERTVQKQLSWTGRNTKKPSMKFVYKGIVDGIHVAMKQQFQEYTIVCGEARLQNILKNAAK